MNEIKSDLTNAINSLKLIYTKYGCYSVSPSWWYGDETSFQMDYDDLISLSNKYDKDIRKFHVSDYIRYEMQIGDFILFSIKDRFYTEK